MMDGAGPVFRAIDRSTKVIGTETIAVIDAFGRVAFSSVKAPRDLPPRNISALDGYVVKGAGDTFINVGAQEMGGPLVRLREGRAVFVPTGAPLLAGGRFVMRENVLEQENGTVWTGTQRDERKEWERGSWLKKGTRIIGRGSFVTPEVMERLSLAGIETVEVYRQAQVAVMTTGDELRSGVVPDSNRHLLSGLIQRDRGSLYHIPTAPDRVDDMAAAIRCALASDMLIITGGTAKGKKDMTREALREVEARILIDRPRILPGRTMAFGLLGAMPFFLLPGNPKAISTLYEIFVKRCLLKLHGVREMT